jgi:hypothetical protein
MRWAIYVVATGFDGSTVDYYCRADMERHLSKKIRLQLWNEPGTIAIL